MAELGRKTKRYPSDLTDEEWARIEPLLPKPARRGRKPAVDLREVLNAIRYMARSAGGWRMLPVHFGPWQTVYWWFRRFVRRLPFRTIHDVALMLDREAAGREASPTGGVLDSQTVKAPFAEVRGYDGGKRIVGRKRHVAVDTDGRLLMVNLTPDDVSDSAGAQTILDAIRKRWPWMKHLFADAGYDRTKLMDKAAFLDFVVEIVRRSDKAVGFEVIPRRWVVERTFGWMIRWRRLVRDYEKRLDVSEAMIHVAMHAQRDACEAYVASQRAEGWVLLRDHYDDGGFSGGTLERPALQRLLRDIQADLVDVIVVYKIDRLSRSLMDFAKLVEVMDAHGVTFVSVTQSFNTTTSMGRLTLNILLSFAQFEREVIGERIRDKFSASRARGMWMAGKVPLGYDVVARKLVVNAEEAPRVRRVFEIFTETGSGIETVTRLRAEGATSKAGRTLDKGDVYKLLNNRTYVGEAAHKGQIYPSEHQGIVPRELWDRAHAVLQVSPRVRANQHRAQTPALVKALALAFRYQRMLDDGRYASITEMAEAGRLERGYLDSLLGLTLLAPDLVEAILDGRQPGDVTLPALMEPFPLEWERQF